MEEWTRSLPWWTILLQCSDTRRVFLSSELRNCIRQVWPEEAFFHYAFVVNLLDWNLWIEVNFYIFCCIWRNNLLDRCLMNVWRLKKVRYAIASVSGSFLILSRKALMSICLSMTVPYLMKSMMQGGTISSMGTSLGIIGLGVLNSSGVMVPDTPMSWCSNHGFSIRLDQ